jgi:polyisoprenoid-binding protein YceI
MKARYSGSLAILALIAVVAVPSPAQAEDKVYYFGVSDQRTNVSFESSTDFEQILGSTNKLTGKIIADLEKGSGSVKLAVPVSSMRTGIDLRDEHMRSPGWLDAESYPEISFVADNVKRLSGGRWEASGKFTMHGVSKDLRVTVDVKEIPAAIAEQAGLESGEWLKISTSFEVKLSDYGVKIPGMAAAKVNDTWGVRVQAFASTGAPVGGK